MEHSEEYLRSEIKLSAYGKAIDLDDDDHGVLVWDSNSDARFYSSHHENVHFSVSSLSGLYRNWSKPLYVFPPEEARQYSTYHELLNDPRVSEVTILHKEGKKDLHTYITVVKPCGGHDVIISVSLGSTCLNTGISNHGYTDVIDIYVSRGFEVNNLAKVSQGSSEWIHRYLSTY